MFTKLFLLFIIVPFIELYALIAIGEVVGAANTVLLVMLTGAVGAYLAKREGIAVWGKIQRELKAGNLPKDELLDGVLLLVSGIVLITPGIFTDMFGIILLTPFGRAFVRKYISNKIKKSMNIHVSGAAPQPNNLHHKRGKREVEDADYTILED